jgi:hypothetical protein
MERGARGELASQSALKGTVGVAVGDDVVGVGVGLAVGAVGATVGVACETHTVQLGLDQNISSWPSHVHSPWDWQRAALSVPPWVRPWVRPAKQERTGSTSAGLLPCVSCNA